MMATISELSMYQAESLQYQQRSNDMQSEVDEAARRLEAGEAPTAEAAEEWNRMERIERQRREALERQDAEAEDLYSEQKEGLFSTAESRPNAYIPEGGEELPIPKPYSAFAAPFLPSKNGSNMRHFRKPEVKPIEI